jgi:hypothetical protein
MNKRFYNYMNTSELMDEVLENYKKSFFHQIGTSLIYSAITASALVLLSFALAVAFAVSFSQYSSFFENINIYTVAALGAIAVLGIGFAILVQGLQQATSSILAWQAFSGRAPDLKFALLGGLKAFFRIVTVVIAQVLIMAPAFLMLGFAAYFTAKHFSWDAPQIFYAISRTGSGFIGALGLAFIMVAVIMGISFVFMVLYNWFSISIPCAVFEEKWFFSALIHSFRLTKGDFWRILGARFTFTMSLALIQYSLMSAFYLAFGLIEGLSAAAMGNYSSLLPMLSILQLLVSSLVGTVLAPAQSIFTSLLYMNQRIKRTGLDLEFIADRRRHEIMSERRALQ